MFLKMGGRDLSFEYLRLVSNTVSHTITSATIMHVTLCMVLQPLVSARGGVGTAQLRGARYYWLSYLAEAFAV